jgi:ABC-type phosphonate transport system ATPase subunit
MCEMMIMFGFFSLGVLALQVNFSLGEKLLGVHVVLVILVDLALVIWSHSLTVVFLTVHSLRIMIECPEKVGISGGLCYTGPCL